MQVDLKGCTALVTGAGRGNGRAIAKMLSSNGAKVAVNDLDEKPADEVSGEINESGGQSVAVAADVSNEADVASMVNEVEKKLGTIDILVNNAGVGEAEPFFVSEDDTLWDANLETNLWGAIYTTKHVIDGMCDQEYGKIINITSIHTKNGIGFSPQYDVAKFGLLGFTKSLALELGMFGIRVNAVAPGHTNTRMTENFPPEQREQITDMNPLGRFAKPEEIAEAVLFLSSPASDYINGHELRVDGGQQPIDAFKNMDQ